MVEFLYEPLRPKYDDWNIGYFSMNIICVVFPIILGIILGVFPWGMILFTGIGLAPILYGWWINFQKWRVWKSKENHFQDFMNNSHAIDKRIGPSYDVTTRIVVTTNVERRVRFNDRDEEILYFLSE